MASFACSRNTCDRSLAWSHHRRRSTRAIDRDRGETLPANRTRCCLIALGSALHACTAFDSDARTKDNAWTGHDRSPWMHDDQGPVEKEGGDGGPLKLLTWPFGRWTIDSSLPQPTACFGGCSPNTGERKLKNQKPFCGVVGLDGRCSAKAEQRKKPVAVGPLPGAYLSTETNLVPIRGVIKKEFDTGQTDRQTHTHTHTHTRN